MTDFDRRVLLGIAGVAGAAMASQLTRAGSLNPPPGPVAPTGKTTDQIEPRVDLLNAPASANVTSDANNHYIINNPGSYYLSGNVTASKTNAIQISATGVTLDLCGFVISRTGGATGTAVLLSGTSGGAMICNGTVRGFSVGIDSSSTSGGRLIGVVASLCGGQGFQLGTSFVVESCAATNNSGSGFIAGNGCAFRSCVAKLNGATAFGSSSGCSLDDCSAFGNGGVGAFAGIIVGTGCALTRCTSSSNTVKYGIYAGSGSVLTACVSSANTSEQTGSSGFYLFESSAHMCRAYSNNSSAASSDANGMGFDVDYHCFVQDCSATSNAGNGIRTSSQCVIKNSSSSNNQGSGIRVTNDTCIVQGNTVFNNNNSGVLVDAGVNLIVGNMARANSGGNYSVVAGNRVGEIFVPTTSSASGNTGGTAFTTDPYANIAF